MRDFPSCLTLSGLDAALLANGRAPFTAEAADYALSISKLEPISLSVFALTHCCEHSFEVAPSLPNMNGLTDGVVVKWDEANQKYVSPDLGPMQLNYWWGMKSIFNRDFISDGLLFNSCFGTRIYGSDGRPAPFNGDLIQHGRLAARRILAVKDESGFGSLVKAQAVKYTGPGHQEKRAALFDALMPAFAEFFAVYTAT